MYTPENIMQMSARIAGVINRLDQGAAAISRSAAEELYAKARFGKVSLPRRIALTTLQEGAEQQ